MKRLKYRIVPLPTAVAQQAREAAAAGAPDHAIIIADSPTGYPCRHCVQCAQPGQPVILFPFASVPPGHPYSETGPVFVHADRCERYANTETFPPHFRKNRVLRAYNSKHDMIDAAVVNNDGPEAVIEKLLDNPETDFIQVRSVTRGCYTMGIERV